MVIVLGHRQDLLDLGNEGRIAHLRNRFNTAIKVAFHPVGRADVVLARPAVLEAEEPAVLEESTRDAEDANRVRESAHAGAQATEATHVEHDRNAGPARPVQLADDLQAAARNALGSLPDLWHVHNHSLGKNLALPGALQALGDAGQRLLLQLHDFAEDGRPLNYRHYAVLNGRDLKLLGAAGIPPARLHALANPVSLQADTTASEDLWSRQRRLLLKPPYPRP